jgi:hypothetical protein
MSIRVRNGKCFWGVERGRYVRLTTSQPSVSRLSTQCGIHNILKPYRPAWPIRGVVFYMQMTFVPHRKRSYGLPRPVTGMILSLYVYVKYGCQGIGLCLQEH